MSKRLKGFAAVALIALWAIAAHCGSTNKGNADFNALVGILPFTIFAASVLWMLPSRLGMLAGGVACGGLLVWLWPQLRENVALLYYLQHLGAHLGLGVLFGRTLIGPGEPLITRIARSMHDGALSQPKIRFTRHATIYWTVFFFVNALVSTVLFLLAPPTVWSVYANILTGPLIGLMFLIEHLWCMAVLPQEDWPSFSGVIQAFRAYQRQSRQLGRAPKES